MTTTTNTTTPPCCSIRLNVGGKFFMTTADTLRSLPNTRLGRLTSSESLSSQQDVELFYDRNPKIINSLLDLYRTGELHIPKNLCARTVELELEFWEVPQELIRECCFRGFHEDKEDAVITAEIETYLRYPYDTADDWQKLSTRCKFWLMMERTRLCLASKIWGLVYFTMVFSSVLLYSLESIMSLRNVNPLFEKGLAERNASLEQELSTMTLIDQYFVTQANPWIMMASLLLFSFFLLEFLVRFFACPIKGFFVRQSRNRLDTYLFLHSIVAIVVSEFYVEGRLHFDGPVRIALVLFYSLDALKLLRILYIVKDFDIMKVLLLSARASLKVLLLLLVCMISLAVLFGTSLYLVELLTVVGAGAEPGAGMGTGAGELPAFHTIPHAMWYAVVTMTTVGYGDVVPAGTPGRLLGMLCAFSGLVIIALPVAVVASNFSRYHDNMASRTQLRRRLAFLRERPEAVWLPTVRLPRKEEEGTPAKATVMAAVTTTAAAKD